MIGHGASRQERQGLINFRKAVPGVPLVALLRSMRDDDFSTVDYNCRADDPPLWVRTVTQAIAGIE